MQQETTVTPRIIPIHEIHVAPGHNPRKFFRQAPFDRLVDSIRDKGLIQAITVRPNPLGEGYQLIAGERRLRACRQLALTELPAVIRDVDDDTARHLALLENIDRDNLSVADEALSAQAHVDAYGGDHEAAARSLGWGVQKLRHRLALLHCSENVMNALGEERITLAHAELLAALPAEAQDKALPRILERAISVQELREQVHGFATPLAHAIFDRAAAGCATCVHNSSRQAELFDANIGEARCTNRTCFTAHTQTALDARRTTLREEFGTVAFLTEVVAGKTIPLVVHGANGVGTEQHAKCRGCRHFGAIVDNRLGTTTGATQQPVCFERNCHSQMVAQYQESLAPVVAPEPAHATVAAPAAAAPATPSKSKTATKRPTVKAAPSAVTAQYADTLRRATLAHIPTDPSMVLGLALYALVRVVSQESGVGDVNAVLKKLKLPCPKAKGARDTTIPAALATLDKPALQQAIVAAASLFFDTDAEKSVAPVGTRVDRRALTTLLVDQANVSLMPFVRIDKAFLEAHTIAGIEEVLEESGFVGWIKAKTDGEKQWRAMRGSGKAALITSVLAAGYPGFDNYVPSGLVDQAANWRKGA